MKDVFITLKSGFYAHILISKEAAEELQLCIEQTTFKRFVFKTSANEIVSFSTFDIFKIKVSNCQKG